MFTFYEVYVDSAAVDVHKAQPHYDLWKEFKASGGVESQNVVKSHLLFEGEDCKM